MNIGGGAFSHGWLAVGYMTPPLRGSNITCRAGVPTARSPWVREPHKFPFEPRSGVAEVFGSETNSSAALSRCPKMNRSGLGFEVPQRKANYAYLCATLLPLDKDAIAGCPIQKSPRHNNRMATAHDTTIVSWLPTHPLQARGRRSRSCNDVATRIHQEIPNPLSFNP